MLLHMRLNTFLIFPTILLLQIQSFGIQPQHKPYLNDVFSVINHKNVVISVALSLGLTLSTPLVTYSAESSTSTTATSSLLSKSKSLGLKPPAETVVDLESIRNARIKPLYEEVTFERAVSDRNEVKTRFDMASKFLRDSKIDLSSAKSLLKKYENELTQVDRKIQNVQKGKDNRKQKQALAEERKSIKTSINKGQRTINSLESFIKKTTNELDVLQYRLKDSDKMVQQRKDELSRKLKDIALVKQQTAQKQVEKEKADQKKQLRLNLDNAQKSLESARQDAIKAKALNEKLKQAKSVAVGEKSRLKAVEEQARRQLVELNARVAKAEANLAMLLSEESTAATRLQQLEQDIASTTDIIRTSEAAIAKATDQYNIATSNLK